MTPVLLRSFSQEHYRYQKNMLQHLVSKKLLTNQQQEDRNKAFMTFINSGQIIATSHVLTANGGLVREIFLFQENLGWRNVNYYLAR